MMQTQSAEDGDDVVLLGAFGGYLRGRAEVDARFDRTARAYGGGWSSFENLATWVSADLACIVYLEHHHETRLAGHGPVEITYRVTHLFRREPDGWKVVLRHANPPAEFRGPESVLPRTGQSGLDRAESLRRRGNRIAAGHAPGVRRLTRPP
jgi:ketosteroid isomerase-like protein